VSLDALVPLDDLAGRMTGRGVPDRLLTLGKFGAAHQLYVPWMQASYIMVANNAALPYLPDGADLDALGYDQLAAWASALQAPTWRSRVGLLMSSSSIITESSTSPFSSCCRSASRSASAITKCCSIGVLYVREDTRLMTQRLQKQRCGFGVVLTH
jgi:hypothetical protein